MTIDIDYIEKINNSVDELLKGNITKEQHMSLVSNTIKHYFLDGRCTECGSIHGEPQYWNSGNNHYSELFLCPTCMSKFSTNNQM